MPIIEQTIDGDKAALAYVDTAGGHREDWHRIDDGWLILDAGLNPNTLNVNPICLRVQEWENDDAAADAYAIDEGVKNLVQNGYSQVRNSATNAALADRIENTAAKCENCLKKDGCVLDGRESCEEN